MTKNEVMQMALDVFTNKRYARASAVRSASVVSLIDALALAKVTEANKELRAALAQPELKPVAWMEIGNYINEENLWCERKVLSEYNNGRAMPLYTAPPQSEWIGLTENELSQIHNSANWNHDIDWSYERAIEAKLKEKNT